MIGEAHCNLHDAAIEIHGGKCINYCLIKKNSGIN